MIVGIEVEAESLDRTHSAAQQCVLEALEYQLDTSAVCVSSFGRLRLQRTLEVIDERQQLLEHISRRGLRLGLALALDALAIVVEFGGLPKQSIVVFVTLALELGYVVDLLTRRLHLISRRRGVGGGIRLIVFHGVLC